MSDAASLVYLEADDEITAVVRRVRAADPGRVIVVAPGRSRATSSAVALRLLARAAADAGRQVAVVGDPLTRSLAAEAGIPAFASVDDARRAGAWDAPGEPGPEAASRHAAIHVVRGAAAEDTAPTMAAIATAAAARETALPVPDATPTTVGRRSSAPPRTGRRDSRRRAGLPVVLGLAATLLLTAIVAGATLLPAATITIVPRTEPVTASYDIVVSDPERRTGTVEASVAVVATGEYELSERATGAVTLRNFNSSAVDVPAGTLVAAGRQAFETTEEVSVPSGSLTASGTIHAGEADVTVVASAPGPAANVEAEAIDTVLSQGTAARLRAFPNNAARLVVNAEPTTGGVAERGPEITEADVEDAVAALRAELERRADESRPADQGALVLDVGVSEPEIELPDDLVGMRNTPEAEIAGSLEWEVTVVDPTEVEAEATDRLASDPAVPAEHDLLPGATSVHLGEPRLDGDAVVVPAAVEGRSAPRLVADEVIDRTRGLSAQAAGLALAELGTARIELWPGWVATVPKLDWRIDVRIAEPSP